MECQLRKKEFDYNTINQLIILLRKISLKEEINKPQQKPRTTFVKIALIFQPKHLNRESNNIIRQTILCIHSHHGVILE
jgi:hypothetical protein